MTLGVAAGGGTYFWPKDCGRRLDHIVRPDNIGVMAYASWRQPRCETRSPFAVWISHPWALNHSTRSIRCPKIRTKLPLPGSWKPAAPTLIIHGNQDIVVMPINAFLLAQHLPNAQLILYPDASHGAQSQHADVFLEYARLFLNG